MQGKIVHNPQSDLFKITLKDIPSAFFQRPV
jgi:hypothetical protein